MKKIKKAINKVFLSSFALLTIFLPIVDVFNVNASTAIVLTAVNVRSIPGTGSTASILGHLAAGATIDYIDIVSTVDGSRNCDSWYKFLYNGTIAYSCVENFDYTNKYDRPWTTPKKAIIGGAIFKSENYISKGQFTSYLFKFNVNPASANQVYTHQYMTNIRAVASEALSSYNTYLSGNLLDKTLVFTIPTFENMTEYTNLPEQEPDTSGMTAAEANDPSYEAYLDSQGFKESYKKKLRMLHKSYPNWVFEALNTGLDWATSISAEQPLSYVDGSNVSLRETFADAQRDGVYCKDGSGAYCLKESTNWYLANTQTTAYYMDPRNFLNPQGILMFEKLAYSSIYTEELIQSRLDGTFMSGVSDLDKQTYASIFVEAGRIANVSAVYLTSQCLQEVGSNGSTATTGEQFTYNGVTYKGLYNFFNVGATDANSPARSGLVWANGGSTATIVSGEPSNQNNEISYISKLGFSKATGYLTGIALGQSVSSLIGRIPGATVTVVDSNGVTLSNNSILATGQKVIITDSNSTYTNTIVVYGDMSGDGEINAIDLLLMRRFLLNTQQLTGANLQAAKIAKNSDVSAADLLYLRRYLLDSQTYKITQ